MSNEKSSLKLILSLLSGPVAFLIVKSIPIPGLDPKAQISAAVFAWLIFWWSLKPIPWTASAMVPLLLFPAMGVMKLKDAAGYYGQGIFFLLLATFLLGEAMSKHGLGERLTLTFLSSSWIKGSFTRFIFAFVIVAFILSAVISSSALAVLIPIATATVAYLAKEYEENGIKVSKAKLGTFITLAILYACEAGFMVTPLGAPHNIGSIGLLEQTSKITITFIQWMETGTILGIILLVIGFFVAKIMFNPGVEKLPGQMEHFREERQKLGKMKTAEWLILVVLGAMAVLLILPSFIKIKWLDIYWVMALVGLLLYLLPVDKKGSVLSGKDIAKVNWDIILLATTGVAVAGMLGDFGLIPYISSKIGHVSGFALLLIAAIGTAALTNFVSGFAATITMCTLLFPLIGNIGIHPAVVARIIPALGVGMIFPWAGVTAALTFSSGLLEIKDMVKGGLVVTAIYIVIGILGNMILVPLFKAYTPM